MKKAQSVRRNRVQKTSEQEFVRETVSKATGVHFEVVAPNPAFPFAVDRLEWFMRCRNKEEIAERISTRGRFARNRKFLDRWFPRLYQPAA